MVPPQWGPGLREEDGDFPGCCMCPRLHSRSPRLQHGCCSRVTPEETGCKVVSSWLVTLTSPGACTMLLAPRSSTEPLAEEQGLIPASSRPAPARCRPRAACGTGRAAPCVPAFPGTAPCVGTQPAARYVPGLCSSHLPGCLDTGCCSAPSPWGSGVGGLCQHAVCIPCRTPDRWPGTAWHYGRSPRLLPPLCHLPALPLQLPLGHSQEEEGPENQQGDTTGDAELGLASLCVGGWGGEGLQLGGSAQTLDC